MAYAEKYYMRGTSPKGVGFRISLLKNGYGGGTTELNLNMESLRLDYKHSDWFRPIIGNSCSFSIFNDASTTLGWYDLEDITTLEEREFQITIDASYNGEEAKLFDGWINSDVVTQKYYQKSTIKLTGSNYLAKLDGDFHPSIINTIAKRSFIDIINETLKLTGKSDNIRVNNTLDPSEGTLSSGKTAFNIAGVDTEVFWKNNIERESGKKIIDNILTPLDSYVYWWDDMWYIQRYVDIWTTDGSKNWVEYDQDASYGYGDTGTLLNINEVSTNLPISSTDIGDDPSIGFIKGSQIKSNIPGLQNLIIKQDQKAYLNLTTNDFTNINATGQVSSVTYPAKRTWDCYYIDNGKTGTTWWFPGFTGESGDITYTDTSLGYGWFPTYDDDTSIYRFPGMTYQSISNAIFRAGAPVYFVGGVDQYKDKNRSSLSTRFDVTVEDKDTALNLKWKFAPIGMNPFPYDPPGYGQWDYRCKFILRNPPGNNYIVYRPDEDVWDYTSSFLDASSYVILEGANDFGDDGVAEVSITVPIGDVSGWTFTGDTDLVLSIMGEDIRQYDEDEWRGEGSYPGYAYYGDVEITASGNPQNNKFTSVVSNTTLNEKTVTMAIFDLGSLNYRNGIFTGTDLDTRTTEWTDDAAAENYPLYQWLIKDRWQLYNRNRKKITGTMRYPGFIKPLSMWYDNSDPSIRQYVLTSYTYNIGTDNYKGTWLEYDNSETININIV